MWTKLIRFQSLISMTVLALFVLSGTSLVSCKKEGCTNEKSDNYDPDAKEDDNSCILWREKLVGKYNGNISCIGQAAVNAQIEITASVDGDAAIVIQSGDQQFKGTMTSSTVFNIPDQERTVGALVIKASGQGEIKEGKNLTMVVTTNGVVCTWTGTKL